MKRKIIRAIIFLEITQASYLQVENAEEMTEDKVATRGDWKLRLEETCLQVENTEEEKRVLYISTEETAYIGESKHRVEWRDNHSFLKIVCGWRVLRLENENMKRRSFLYSGGCG
ncbi:MAG: hypothetical protein BYD32DRAFT_421629 [Podila humilis]|nr:MAG: hypothetical protein BYD32DRAFT_421629 [Podila humilis]